MLNSWSDKIDLIEIDSSIPLTSLRLIQVKINSLIGFQIMICDL